MAAPEGEKTAAGFDYDLICIGGGSGGLACSREAAKLGAKVLVLDYVSPSTQGTTWGLGGTCVNVGCIPKKLMHTAALYGELVKDAASYGWNTAKDPSHKWASLMNAVQDHIGSLNWGYRQALDSEGVKYINGFGTLLNKNTVEVVDIRRKKHTVTAEFIVIAVGGRPAIPDDVPGAREFAVSSDDIFSLDREPGKTLVVGASYVALECAGFLHGIGFDVTIAVRSILLRGFDQACAEMIGGYMERHGIKFLRPSLPEKIEKQADGRFKVTIKRTDSGEVIEDVYDTVLYATGREAVTKNIGLEAAGVKTNPKTGKIPCKNEATNVPNIFAIGDVIEGVMELTPTAIKAGRLLAARLFEGKTLLMNYQNVPTTVFTPLEYGSIGLSEEAAIEANPDDIEVYHSYFQPLEWTVAHRPENDVYGKIIVRKSDDLVLGFHYLGPNAGEVTQGFGVAFTMGAKKSHWDATVGIHPTIAESFTTMTTTKSSGKDPKQSGC